jgi:nucleotide-binding universal stress UspA family protein
VAVLTTGADRDASPALVALERRPSQILVAIDSVGGPSGALGEAIRLALAGHARLTVVAVVAPPPLWWVGAAAYVVPWRPEDLRRAAVRQAEIALAGARAAVPPTISLTTRILFGRAARALLGEAAAVGYDLVVVGVPGDRGTRAWARTAGALARRCPVSVLVVRP